MHVSSSKVSLMLVRVRLAALWGAAHTYVFWMPNDSMCDGETGMTRISCAGLPGTLVDRQPVLWIPDPLLT